MKTNQFKSNDARNDVSDYHIGYGMGTTFDCKGNGDRWIGTVALRW